MAVYITQRRLPLDDVTDPRLVAEYMPRYRESLEATHQVRTYLQDLVRYGTAQYAFGRHGRPFKRLASIPWSVMDFALRLRPDLLLDRKVFYSWLNNHDGYIIERPTS